MIKQLKPVYIIGLSLFFIVLACNKNDDKLSPTQIFASKVIDELKDSVSANEFTNFDSKKTILYKLDEEHKVLYISTKDSNRFILVETDNSGLILKGKIIQINLSENEVKSNKLNFNGNIVVLSLNGNLVKQNIIVNNKISKDSKNSGITSNSVTDKLKPLEEEYTGYKPPLQEVIVFSYINSNTSYLAFNLLDIAGIGDYGNQYLPVYPDYGGSSGDILTVNYDIAENKDKVDPQKMIDCFGTISSVGASYSITIHANLPVDGRPDLVINDKLDAGHAFLTLSKSNSNGESITQVLGFYPKSTISAITLVGVPSMIVNDQDHDFGASYTINVNYSQFQNALTQSVTLSNNSYNLLNFNCTDYALGVFNVAGGNLQVSPLVIPATALNPFSLNVNSTPSTLYNQIKNLQNLGNTNTQSGKLKASSSHGPC